MLIIKKLQLYLFVRHVQKKREKADIMLNDIKRRLIYKKDDPTLMRLEKRLIDYKMFLMGIVFEASNTNSIWQKLMTDRMWGWCFSEHLHTLRVVIRLHEHGIKRYRWY